MKNRILLILLTLIILSMACSLPSFGKKDTPTQATPTPTPDSGMQLYYGIGMQIMLPRTYVAENIDSALPTIIATIKDFVGGESSPLSGLVDSIEGNIGWYGYDGGTAAVYPTRLIVLRNKAFSKLPVSMITIGLEQVLGNDSAMVDSDSVKLGSRNLTRLTYSKDSSAWVAYIFKEADYLWLALYLTTPANLAAEIGTFELSIASIQIDAVQPAP
jgi:hypothetical protein